MWMLLVACGGPAGLSQPHPPPEWPIENVYVKGEGDAAAPAAPAPEAPPQAPAPEAAAPQTSDAPPPAPDTAPIDAAPVAPTPAPEANP